MGFYAPAQIVRNAQQHSVEVRPVCVNASRWDCTLEPAGDEEGRFAVRLGLCMVKGLGNAEAARLVSCRADQPYASVDDLWRRAGITGEKSVFDRRDIARALHRALHDDPDAFQGAWATVIAASALVELQTERVDPATGEVLAARYSTREMVAVEGDLVECARRLLRPR